MTNPTLRALIDLRDKQIQKARIQFSNRLSAIDRQSDNSEGSGQRKVVDRWLEVFTTLEKQLDKDITDFVKDLPIYGEMSKIKGVGPLTSAKLIAMIDIRACDTISALWKFSGYGQEDYWVNGEGIIAPVIGRRWVKKLGDEDELIKSGLEGKMLVRTTPKPLPDWHKETLPTRMVSGWMLSHNARLKSNLFVLGGSFLKSNSPYRKVYDDYKIIYGKREEWKPKRVHLAAQRKMIKIFLSHLWLRWRELEALPVSEPYVYERLGHSERDYYRAEDFGW